MPMSEFFSIASTKKRRKGLLALKSGMTLKKPTKLPLRETKPGSNYTLLNPSDIFHKNANNL